MANDDELLQPLKEAAANDVVAAQSLMDNLFGSIETSLPTFFLYQPLRKPCLRGDSPGTLFDVGPLPKEFEPSRRSKLFLCAAGGRTGEFFADADRILVRVPSRARIDRVAEKKFMQWNTCNVARAAIVDAEKRRHGLAGEFPSGVIYHLAMAPIAPREISTRRVPVLGVVSLPRAKRVEMADDLAYNHLVEFAAYPVDRLIATRLSALLTGGSTGIDRVGLCTIVDRLTENASDQGVRTAIRLVLAHHWVFCLDAAAFELLSVICGSAEKASRLVVSHGWSPPPRFARSARSVTELHHALVSDFQSLMARLGNVLNMEPFQEQWRDRVAQHLNAALAALCGRVLKAVDGSGYYLQCPVDSARENTLGLVLKPSGAALGSRSEPELLGRARMSCCPGQSRRLGLAHTRDQVRSFSSETGLRTRAEKDHWKWLFTYTLRRVNEHVANSKGSLT